MNSTNAVSPLAQVLRDAGYRLTSQRLAICGLLEETQSHPTAQMIYEQLSSQYKSLSLATVYNTLDALVALGAINALGTAGDEAVHYDADTEPHVNLACISCHRVIDLPSEFIHALDREIAEKSGYRLLGTRVLYYGLCPQCQSEMKAE